MVEAGESLCQVEYVEFTAAGSHGNEPPRELWEACFGELCVALLRKKAYSGPSSLNRLTTRPFMRLR